MKIKCRESNWENIGYVKIKNKINCEYFENLMEKFNYKNLAIITQDGIKTINKKQLEECEYLIDKKENFSIYDYSKKVDIERYNYKCIQDEEIDFFISFNFHRRLTDIKLNMQKYPIDDMNIKKFSFKKFFIVFFVILILISYLISYKPFVYNFFWQVKIENPKKENLIFLSSSAYQMVMYKWEFQADDYKKIIEKNDFQPNDSNIDTILEQEFKKYIIEEEPLEFDFDILKNNEFYYLYKEKSQKRILLVADENEKCIYVLDRFL